MIFILEDNEERVRQFRAAAAAIAPDMPVRFWRSAHEMIADLVDGLEHPSIISLDHDLNRFGDEPDPGTGYGVAKLLEELIPCCPIVIHTSNGERRTWMGAHCSARVGNTTTCIHSETIGSRRTGPRWCDGGSAGRNNPTLHWTDPAEPSP